MKYQRQQNETIEQDEKRKLYVLSYVCHRYSKRYNTRILPSARLTKEIRSACN
jgi:hypothetical protein